MKKSSRIYAHIAFVVVGAAILVFLLRAPEETTAPLPADENHQRFMEMESKKEAEKYCHECHSPDQANPLPADHPATYRCLFCHKRNT